MVTERARITVEPGKEDAFAEAFARAKVLVTTSPGCHGARLLRSIEAPSEFLLLIEWATLEAHTEGFRSSDNFTKWREHVGPFFAAPAEVMHFNEVALA